MVRTTVLFAASALIALSAPALVRADSLPKEAVALKASEVKALYAGNSSNWEETRAYFAPDGTVTLFKKDKTLWAEGRWTVTDNQACMNVFWHDIKNGKTGKHTDCWTWFRHGKGYLTLWSGSKDKKTAMGTANLRRFERVMR